MSILLSCVPTLSVLFCEVLLILHLRLSDASIVCESNLLLSCSFLSLSTLFLVCLTVGCLETQAVVVYLLVLQRICIWHFYLCVLILLYTCIIIPYLIDCMFFNMTEVFLLHAIRLSFDFGSRILNTLNGIKLPLLLVSILYIV